ncbi:MAG: methionyl-tRNA formyltransferase, partial [Rhodobacterales bacterium CG_4_10_14_0_8_um_filter_70_9]
AGRGKRLQPTPVHLRAEALGLAVRTPVTLRDAEAQAEFAALGLDAAVVVAYGLILPQPVLDAPRLGCVNLHASLLPRWRGAAPIQRAIMAGDAETGVCVMRMEQGLDTGPVLARLSTPIGADETAGELAERLARLGAPLVVETLRAMAAGRATATPQPEDGALYARKIDKAEARLDWREPAAALAARIRALTPAPGAWTMLGEERLKVLAAHPEPGEGPPGTVLDDALLVACGAGALRIDRAQRPGRAPTACADLLRGLTVAPGAVLT